MLPNARLKDTLPEADWQERKAKWKAVLLSVPVTFSEVLPQDVWKAAFNRRQGVLQEHESLSRTGMQAAMEVAHFKTLVEAHNPSAGKLTAQALSAEFIRLGLSQVIGGTRQDEEEADGGSLAPTFIAQALNVHKTVMSQPRCVELLMDLEHKFGTRSCFHKMSKLSLLASKPTSAASRIWILESLHDQLCFADLKPSEITRTSLAGDRSHCGLVALFECKQRVLDYIHSDLLPRAGVLDSDRHLLKEATLDHSAYRAHSGDGDITWQARLQKSSIQVFELIADLVFDKKCDGSLRQVARSGGLPEQVWEMDQVKEYWAKIKTELAKEDEERKARSMPVDNEASAEEHEDALTVARKAPASFVLHSPGYWSAVGNQAVRTYVSLVPEPKTIQGVETAVGQSSLREIIGCAGASSVLSWLDLDSVGESQGPGQQPLLRKKYTMDTTVLKKLVQGALMGRGAQKRGQAGAEEATRVPEGDLVMIHSGFSHPSGQREAKGLFRLSTSKKEGDLDSEVKEILVIYEDESIRNRKQRVKGSYVSSTCVTVATSTIFTQCVPEKAYEHHPGHCFSNVMCNVKALTTTEAWHLSRQEKEEVLGKDRVVTVTEEAAAKKAESGGEGLESVFSSSALPVPFYQDLIRGHSAKAVLDLAAGQGNFAKAALLERIPYYAFTLTESHSKKLEVILTQFLVDEMKKEGSTHFRPEALQEPQVDSAQDLKKRPKGGEEGSEVQPKKKPKAKAKAKNKKDDDDGENGDDEQGAGEGDDNTSPLPW